MRLKRMVLVGLVILVTGAVALNAQVSFIDQYGLGMAIGLNEPKKTDSGYDPFGGLFDNFHFITEYWLGAYVQNIDSAIYAGLRWDLEVLDAGLMLDYHFTNSMGFSLGAGAEVMRTDLFGDYKNEPEHEMVPYVRVGAFYHFLTAFKFGADFTYKTNGQQRLGLYMTFSVFSMLDRAENYQPIRRTSNRDIIGHWAEGDTENGLEYYFNDDFTMRSVIYEDGESTVIEGTWATTDEGGLLGAQFVFFHFTDNTSLSLIYDVFPEDGLLGLAADSESIVIFDRLGENESFR